MVTTNTDTSGPIVMSDCSTWHRIPRACPKLPASFDTTDADAVISWITRLGPIETSEIHSIETAMRAQIERNKSRLPGSRQILAIDGDAALGKTISVITAMLRIYDDLLASVPEPAPQLTIDYHPVVYLSDVGGSFTTLVKRIATFTSYETYKNVTADDLLHNLPAYLGRIGTQLIVIDDAHMLRRVGASRGLTDDLKRLIDALPVSFVFVGAGLKKSSLYKSSATADEYSAAEQLKRRIREITLEPLATTPSQHKVWLGRISRLSTEIETIDGYDWTVLRDRDFLRELHHASEGSTGVAFELIKDALTRALRAQRTPSIQDLTTVITERAH